MQLVFHASARFEDDLALLGEGERNIVVGQINEVFHRIACEGEAACSLLLKPEELKLKSGCCSTLSVLPVDARMAVIFAIDEDPIFDQLIISLIRVVSQGDIPAAYREAARWLYHLHLDESSPGCGDGHA
jgi:hypothetical protein